MLQRIENLNQAVWGDKVTLATTAHFLGGLGLGMVMKRTTVEGARPLAYGLIAISLLAHLYALLTMSSLPQATRERTRMSV